MNYNFDLIVIGGGAAGFFGAITAASRNQKVVLLEKSLKVLSKVRISGGGRCNVTHACFDPRQLATRYPRGSQELLGPFHRFQPKDTIAWFLERDVELKVEEDGRMFPITDSSETIIDCLQKAALKEGVEVKLGVHIKEINKGEFFEVKTDQMTFTAQKLLLATGSSPQGHLWASQLGHSLTPLVPSLFTFNVPTSPLLDLAGIAVPQVSVSIEGTPLKESGPLLLTHWGFSGPAILRLSAWGARELNACNYRATLKIDWTAGISQEKLKQDIIQFKKRQAAQIFTLEALYPLPKNLARRLCTIQAKRFSDLSSKDIDELIQILTASRYAIDGKTTYKQEFVTCGGVKLDEINFKTMESRHCPGLYFAGEILDIDGITGGFNFQNAWTTSWIAGNSI